MNTLPEKYDALKKDKIASGLSPADAHEVTERQMAHDAALAKADAKEKSKAADSKNPAKPREE